MITYDGDYIDRLNRTLQSGKFLKTAILTETLSPFVQKYWVDHEVAIEFGGNTYEPLSMHWGSITVSQSMPIAGIDIGLSNVSGKVAKYAKTFDVTGNPIMIQLLHLDLLSNLTNHWKRMAKVLAIRMERQSAVVTVGRNLGRNKLPRRVILNDEFPGISTDVARIL